MGLLALGLGTLQVVLDKGQRDDWFGSHFIMGMTVIAVSALVAVIFWEWRHKNPIIDLHLFRDRSFAIGNLLMFMVGFALLSSTVLIPLFLQTIMGYTAQQSGLALMPGGIVIIMAMPLVGYLLGHYDARILLLFGLTAVGLSLFHMTSFRRADRFSNCGSGAHVPGAGARFPVRADQYDCLCVSCPKTRTTRPRD